MRIIITAAVVKGEILIALSIEIGAMDAIGFQRRSGAARLPDRRREVLEEMTDVVAIDQEGIPLEEGFVGVHEGGHGVVVEEEGVSPYKPQIHHRLLSLSQTLTLGMKSSSSKP